MTAAIIRYMKDSDVANFYAELRKVVSNASTTNSSGLPYEIKGKFISPNDTAIAVSPKGDRIFTFAVENGAGVGYISGFDESKKTKIFDTPLTETYVAWPEENTVALGTKASAGSPSYFYLIDLKKPYLRRVVGGQNGLTANVNPDATRILYSYTNGNSLSLSLYNVKDGSTQETALKTASEKCIWSKLHPTEAYCAVPTTLPQGTYPDDWYKGIMSFNDQIWHIDTVTGDVQLVANLLQLSNDVIDGVNLSLDPKENFLYFVNKRDLTLWSLDLTQ